MPKVLENGMRTVITDKTDFASIEAILQQFSQQDAVDVYSSGLSPIEQAIAMGKLEISDVVIQPDNDKLLVVLNSGTVIERKISQIEGLSEAREAQLLNYENMGNGILWEEVPQADISLKRLLEEELLLRYNLNVV